MPGSTQPYSGRLTDPSGQPVADGLYDFVFTLYASEKDDQALWSEMQLGVPVKSGNVNVALGQNVPIAKDVSDRKGLWLAVSVRGPQEPDFTLLNPRRNLAAPDSVSALTCPHSHFTDNWTGTNNAWGLYVENTSTGDGLRAYSRSTVWNYAAVFGANIATTGYGTGVYGYSSNGVGVYANSSTGDGLEATTASTTKSAIYAHATNANGVWAVSTNKQAVHGSSTASYGVYGESVNAHGGYFTASNYAGAYIKTDLPSSFYGAVVDGGLHVINGNCDGCALVYSGQNDGTADIEKGDLVAVVGVKVDPATQQPILLVRRATNADDAVIGVALGPAAPPSEVDRTGPVTAGKSGSGVVAAGEYVQVMIRRNERRLRDIAASHSFVHQRWLVNQSHTPQLWQVAWDGDQVAGMVLARIDEVENRELKRKRGYTEHVFVRHPWRQRGLAKVLVVRSLRVLKERDMQEAELGVDSENESGAFGFYQRLGYVTFSTDIWFRKPMDTGDQ